MYAGYTVQGLIVITVCSLDCHLEGGLLGGRAHVVQGGVGEGEG